MTTKPLKRLSSLEIDEVSLVDRPANQHGLVTITKRDEGSRMAVYDAQGYEIDENSLQSGDVVFDGEGNEITMLSDEDLQALLESGEVDADELEIVSEADGATAYDREDELVGVGKNVAADTYQAGKKVATRTFREARTGFRQGKRGFTGHSGSDVVNAGRHVGRNTGRYGLAAGATGTYVTTKKSLGEAVLSDLSKALTDGDRDQVISKMADRLSEAEQYALEAVAKAEQLEAEQEFAEYVEVAKSFDLPVDPEDLGGILQEVSKVLSDEQLDVLERILHTAAAAIDFEERGSAGGSPLMAYVGEEARELVGKSAGEISEAEATTALFSANDDAYLAYLSENQR